jgi:hypothetical protein
MIVTFSQLGNWGRTGNIMFQIATLIATAKRHEAEFYIPNMVPHKLALNQKLAGFNYNTYFLGNLQDHLLTQEVFALLKKTPVFKEYFYTDSRYSEINLDKKNDIYDLVGYFQSHKYFEGAEWEIREALQLPQKITIENTLNAIKKKHSVSNIIAVGIRLTDYLQTEHFYWNLLKTDYYKSAFERFKDCVFLIFSDDIELAQKRISEMNLPYTFEYETDYLHYDIDGLIAYSMCDGYILANSTFHWWGAWLGDPEYKKTVVIPKNWYKQPAHTAEDLYLKNWIIL